METKKKVFSGFAAVAVGALAAGALVASPLPAVAETHAEGEKSCGAKGEKSCAAKHEDCSKLTDAKEKAKCEADHAKHEKDAHSHGEKSCAAKGEKSCGAKGH